MLYKQGRSKSTKYGLPYLFKNWIMVTRNIPERHTDIALKKNKN
tara:strand:+ start:455 stop:586 length:132 start_codon:yes stop_codon:yes gene_type:complete